MHADKADPALRSLFDHVSHTLIGLTGSAPVHHGETTGTNVDWYVVGDDPQFVWFRLIGHGRSNPSNSILFAVPADKRYHAFNAVPGNDWWGKPSSNLIVKAGSCSDFANLLGYLRERYLQLYP